MEISPLILAKMLFVAFLFSLQTGILFDFGRALTTYFSASPKSKKIKSFYNAKILFSDKPLGSFSKKRSNQFLKNATIFLFDVITVFYSGWGIVKINYSYNDGAFRFFTVFAFLIGCLIYYFTLSKLILFLLETSVFVIKYFIVTLFGIIGRPFLIIYNNLVKKIKKMREKFRLYIEKKSKVVYNVEEILYNNENIDKKRVKVRIKSGKKKKRGHEENEGE